jgi:hypothetical protein
VSCPFSHPVRALEASTPSEVIAEVAAVGAVAALGVGAATGALVYGAVKVADRLSSASLYNQGYNNPQKPDELIAQSNSLGADVVVATGGTCPNPVLVPLVEASKPAVSVTTVAQPVTATSKVPEALRACINGKDCWTQNCKFAHPIGHVVRSVCKDGDCKQTQCPLSHKHKVKTPSPNRKLTRAQKRKAAADAKVKHDAEAWAELDEHNAVVEAVAAAGSASVVVSNTQQPIAPVRAPLPNAVHVALTATSQLPGNKLEAAGVNKPVNPSIKAKAVAKLVVTFKNDVMLQMHAYASCNGWSMNKHAFVSDAETVDDVPAEVDLSKVKEAILYVNDEKPQQIPVKELRVHKERDIVFWNKAASLLLTPCRSETNVGDVVFLLRASGEVSIGQVVNVSAQYIQYDLTTQASDCGCPILNQNLTVVAMHAFGLTKQNGGVRITPELMSELSSLPKNSSALPTH